MQDLRRQASNKKTLKLNDALWVSATVDDVRKQTALKAVNKLERKQMKVEIIFEDIDLKETMTDTHDFIFSIEIWKKLLKKFSEVFDAFWILYFLGDRVGGMSDIGNIDKIWGIDEIPFFNYIWRNKWDEGKDERLKKDIARLKKEKWEEYNTYYIRIEFENDDSKEHDIKNYYWYILSSDKEDFERLIRGFFNQLKNKIKGKK
jgi:hypothetical protein